MQRPFWLWPLIIFCLANAAGLTIFVELAPPVRAALVFAFVLVGPGMAFIRLLRLTDPIIELALGVALSLALSAALATLMIYAGTWNPQATLSALIGITMLGVLLQLRPRGWRLTIDD